MIPWHIQKLRPEAVLPSKKNLGDAGWDIVTTDTHELAPGETFTFGTSFAASFSPEYVAVIKPRSSLGSKGLEVLAGVIDASYRGEWKIVLHNASSVPYPIQAGDRIAQCLFVPVPPMEVAEVETLPESERGHGGFGSTGR